jgi:hypothetical protein
MPGAEACFAGGDAIASRDMLAVPAAAIMTMTMAMIRKRIFGEFIRRFPKGVGLPPRSYPGIPRGRKEKRGFGKAAGKNTSPHALCRGCCLQELPASHALSPWRLRSAFSRHLTVDCAQEKTVPGMDG